MSASPLSKLLSKTLSRSKSKSMSGSKSEENSSYDSDGSVLYMSEDYSPSNNMSDDSSVIVMSDDYSPDFKTESRKSRKTQIQTEMDNYNGYYVSATYLPDFNEATINMQINVSRTITKITGDAWGIDTSIPIITSLVVNDKLYRQSSEIPKISVSQFGIPLYQLTNISQKFIYGIWYLGKDQIANYEPHDPVYIDNNRIYIEPYIMELNLNEFDASVLYSLFEENSDIAMLFYTRFIEGDNLLNLTKDYILYRLPHIASHCIHCDQVPNFLKNAKSSMLKPFVCASQLCTYKLSALGLASEEAVSVGGTPNLIHLLESMSVVAFKSKRHKIIGKPYPAITDHLNMNELYLNPEQPDYKLVQDIMDGIPLDREVYNDPNINMYEIMEGYNEYTPDIFRWVISSNRSHIVEIPDEVKIHGVYTDEQYLLLMDSPEKEQVFQDLKAEYGTVYAFHGSALENWHSVLRNGLYVASNTEFQTTGARYGAGIYISPRLGYSSNYSKQSVGSPYRCLALCEIIDKDIKKHTNDIWTVLDPNHVSTRILLVYDGMTKLTNGDYNSTDPEAIVATNEIISYFFG